MQYDVSGSDRPIELAHTDSPICCYAAQVNSVHHFFLNQTGPRSDNKGVSQTMVFCGDSKMFFEFQAVLFFRSIPIGLFISNGQWNMSKRRFFVLFLNKKRYYPNLKWSFYCIYDTF